MKNDKEGGIKTRLKSSSDRKNEKWWNVSET